MVPGLWWWIEDLQLYYDIKVISGQWKPGLECWAGIFSQAAAMHVILLPHENSSHSKAKPTHSAVRCAVELARAAGTSGAFDVLPTPSGLNLG